MTLKPWDDVIRSDMNDPEFVTAYLQASLEDDGIEGLQYALQRIARVQNGAPPSPESDFQSVLESMKKLGYKIQVIRENDAAVDKLVGIK